MSADRHAFHWRLLAPLLAISACLACGSPPPATEGHPPGSAPPTPASGGTLIVGVNSDLSGVNQLVAATDSFTQQILNRMFLHLFEEQPDYAEHPPTMAPSLAETWTWSEDHLELAIELRRDVLWSDGTPVTATDVHWTWQAQIDPEIGWGLSQMKDAIIEMEIVGPHSLLVRWSRAYPGQMTDLNEGVILPQHAWAEPPPTEWRENAQWFVEHLVVNGPFTLDSWSPQQDIVLVRNERYHEPGLPYLDKVVFRIVPETTNQIRQLLAGDLDYVDQVPPAEAATIEASPTLRLVSYWRRQYNFLCWNLRRPILGEAAVRRALTGAIDRQSLVDTLWFGHARVAVSPIISSVWARDPELEPWPYDPQASRRELEALGWLDDDGDGFLERDGQALAFELLTNANSDVRVDAAVMIQEQLRRIGVAVEVETLEFNTVIRRSLEDEFDAVLGAWTIDTSLDLTYAFHSDSVGDGYNFGDYENPALDVLIDEGRFEIDPDRRVALLREAQRIIHLDQPYTFLWESRKLAGLSHRVQDAEPNSLSPYFKLREWWLLPE